MALEVVRKALIVPGRRDGEERFDPLVRRLRTQGVEVATSLSYWEDNNFDRERRRVRDDIRTLRNRQPDVQVTVIGDDWGGQTAWEVAREGEIDKVVAVGSRVNSEPRFGARNMMNDADDPLETERERRKAPLRRGVELLTILPLGGLEFPEEEGTFPQYTEGLTRVVYPHTIRYPNVGIEAILRDESMQHTIVQFVMIPKL